MQELRFVSVQDGWLVATSGSGEQFRIRVDEALLDAVRPRPQSRSAEPKVPPRTIQQLIRAGRTVTEVVAATGADRQTVERFEGPIIAERGYIVEQARAVPVRLEHSSSGAMETTFGEAIDERLEWMEAHEIRWDAWRDPETGWHIGLDFITGDIERHALWKFDARAHALQPDSPAAVTLSQRGEVAQLGGPHLRAVHHDTDAIIPLVPQIPELTPETESATHNETTDLLEQLRRRRGERQHSVYDEMAEYEDDDLVIEPSQHLSEPTQTATITPFAPVSAVPMDEFANDSSDTEPDSPQSAAIAADKPDQQEEQRVDFGAEPQSHGGQPPKKRNGRPAMPSWDEIVFGTRSED